MATPERIYRGSVRALSLVFAVLGLALLTITLVNGGGPLSVGVFLGIAFVAVGVARLWMSGDAAYLGRLVRGWRGG
jgi:hypothetical protein